MENRVVRVVGLIAWEEKRLVASVDESDPKKTVSGGFATVRCNYASRSLEIWSSVLVSRTRPNFCTPAMTRSGVFPAPEVEIEYSPQRGFLGVQRVPHRISSQRQEILPKRDAEDRSGDVQTHAGQAPPRRIPALFLGIPMSSASVRSRGDGSMGRMAMPCPEGERGLPGRRREKSPWRKEGLGLQNGGCAEKMGPSCGRSSFA